MRRGRVAVSCSVLVWTLITTGCGSGGTGDVGTADAVPIEIPEETVEAFGYVAPADTRILIAGFSARIDEVFALPGDLLMRGDRLARMDTSLYQESVARAERRVEVSELRLRELEHALAADSEAGRNRALSLAQSMESGERDLARLKEQYDVLVQRRDEKNDADYLRLINDRASARRMVIRAEEALESGRALLVSGVLSDSEYRDLEFVAEERAAALRNVELSLDSCMEGMTEEIRDYALSIAKAENGIEELRREIEMLEGPQGITVAMQRIQLDLDRLDLAMLRKEAAREYFDGEYVVSPGDNMVVQEIHVVSGVRVGTGQYLCTLIDMRETIVEASVPEEFIADLCPGIDARISPLADRSRVYHGRIERMGWMAINDNGESVVPVRIRIVDDDGFLLPWFTVDITFVLPALI